ncbi:ABC transporter substrate-binding protein [Pueribacillus sp. YX66]|uniref:taurine ABC transporter substrate-binding protein n=1 Tax=Pueribacillus sp. YX66 TaxID=3229242 RepID=UPI00358D90C0
MKKFKFNTIYFLLIAFLLVLNACSNQSGDSKEPKSNTETSDTVVFNIGYQSIPNVEILTKSLGLIEEKLKEMNVEVKWHHFDTGIDVNMAVAAGSIDAGLVGTPMAASGISQDLSYKVVWIYDVLGDNEALVVKENSGIKSLEDLEGKDIAVTFGSTPHYMLLNALKLNNIDENSVTLLDMQPQDIFAAWEGDLIDGGYVWQPVLGNMANRGGNVILTSGDLANDGLITAEVCVVNTDFIEKHPDIVEKYIEAFHNGVEFFRSSPEEAYQIVADELEISVEDASETMDQLIWLNAKEQASEKYLGGDMADVLKDTADFLVNQKSITSAPDLEAFKKAIDPQFVNAIAQ